MRSVQIFVFGHKLLWNVNSYFITNFTSQIIANRLISKAFENCSQIIYEMKFNNKVSAFENQK